MTSLPDPDRPSGDAPDEASASAADASSAGTSIAEKIIERFGGIRPTAAKLEVPVTTVQGWKKRGAIPPTRIDDIRAAAGRFGILIEEQEFQALARSDERKPAAPPAAPPSQPAAAAKVPGGARAPKATQRPERGPEQGPEQGDVRVPSQRAAMADMRPSAARSSEPPASPREPVRPKKPEVPAPTPGGTDLVPPDPGGEEPVARASGAGAESLSTASPSGSDAGEATQRTAPGGQSSEPGAPLEAAAPKPVDETAKAARADQAAVVEPTTEPATDAARGAAPAAPAAAAAKTATVQGAGTIVARAPGLPAGGIERGSQIPPVEIPRYEIPPPQVPITDGAESDGGERPAGATGEGSARRPLAVADAVSLVDGGEQPSSTKDSEPAAPLVGGATADRWASLAFGSAVIAVIMAGMTVISALWPDTQPQQLPASDPAAFTERFRELNNMISRVSNEAVSTSRDLELRLNNVDRRIDQLETQADSGLDDLKARIDGVERSLEEFDQRIMALPVGSPTLAKLLSAAQLRAVLATAQPFQSELAAVRLAGFGDPTLRASLDQIADVGARGIATQEHLKQNFSRVFAQQIITAATSYRPIARLLDSFAGLLETFAPPIYRLTGIPEGDSARALVARAEDYLRTENFQRAVDILTRLSGPAAQQAAPWLAEAQRRVGAERVRTLLNNEMVALVSTVGPQQR